MNAPLPPAGRNELKWASGLLLFRAVYWHAIPILLLAKLLGLSFLVQA